MNSTYSVLPPVVPVSSLRQPKVGEILVGSYGYEASIATFAKVLKVTASTVLLQELDQIHTYTPNTGGMYWDAVPTDQTCGSPKVKRFKSNEGSYSVKWTNYQWLRPWGGEVVSCYNVH